MNRAMGMTDENGNMDMNEPDLAFGRAYLSKQSF